MLSPPVGCATALFLLTAFSWALFLYFALSYLYAPKDFTSAPSPKERNISNSTNSFISSLIRLIGPELAFYTGVPLQISGSINSQAMLTVSVQSHSTSNIVRRPTPRPQNPADERRGGNEMDRSKATLAVPGSLGAQAEWSSKPIPSELRKIPSDTPREIREVLERALSRCDEMQAPAVRNNPVRTGNTKKVYGQANGSDSTVNEASSFGSSPTLSTTRTSVESNLPGTGKVISQSQSSSNHNGTVQSEQKPVGGASKPGPPNNQTSGSDLTTADSTSLPVRKKRSTIFSLFRSNQSKTFEFKVSPRDDLSSDLESSGVPEKPSKVIECASCFDDVHKPSAVNLKCKHSYCKACFNRLVETAMQNENLWPPRCCLLDIPRPVIWKSLSSSNLNTFSFKEKEYTIPIQERWYCVSSKCGRWFDPRTKRTTAKVECPHCRFKMCRYCRGEVHPVTVSCPEDRNLQATIETGAREGWQRCYKCNTMVELQSGCQHITCTCKAHFCYTCGAKWKTCKCTPEDQQRRNNELTDARQVTAREEAELQQAIMASERTARLEAEIRYSEERAEARRIEQERVKKIRAHYRDLTSLLQKLRWSHSKQLAARHERELIQIMHSVEKMEAQRASGKRTLEQAMASEFSRRALEVKKTSVRHCDEICNQMDKIEVLSKGDPVKQVEILEELQVAHEAERARLRMLHDRNIRIINGQSQPDSQFDEDLSAKKAQVLDLEESRTADGSWLNLVHEVARGFLEEEEIRLLESGGSLSGMALAPKDGTPGASGEAALHQLRPALLNLTKLR